MVFVPWKFCRNSIEIPWKYHGNSIEIQWKYMELKDLQIYRLAREIGNDAWIIYEKLTWQDKKTMGDQFIRAIDSVSANIAEGFGRFHYLDKNKFNLNARGSLYEAVDWLEKLFTRNKISKREHDNLEGKLKNLGVKLNNYIQSTRRMKNN